MDNNKDTAYASEGPKFMGSYATRHFFYDVDPKLAKKYNENYKGDLQMVIFLIVIAIITGSLSVWLFSLGGIWRIILGIVTSLISIAAIGIAIIGIKRAATPTALLKRGALNSGIIAKIDSEGIGILVLAETTAESEVHWGLCSIRVKDLPPVHERKIGERIPVTCTYGSTSNEGYYISVGPSLIAWGTNSKEVIQQAIDAIDEVEWDALEQCIDRYDFKTEYSDFEKLKQLTFEELVNLKLIY